MDDHFWPALYPGLIVGLLYGLSIRGWANTLVSAVGGLIGAALAYELLLAIGMNDGLVSVAAMVVIAFGCSYGAVEAYRRVFRTS